MAQGRKAEKILGGIESRHRAEPANPRSGAARQRRCRHRLDYRPSPCRPARGVCRGKAVCWRLRSPSLGTTQAEEAPWANRLIYGDNLLAIAALLAGDDTTPSLRGKVDLIIDPPFDSKADYRTKVTLPGLELEQKPTVIEQFAYSDTWSDGNRVVPRHDHAAPDPDAGAAGGYGGPSMCIWIGMWGTT